jgi:hypothetical protein
VPSEVIKKLDIPRTCGEFESKAFCSDGKSNEDNAWLKNEALKAVLFEESYGIWDMTAVDACCACGGGIRPDDGEVLYNQLEEWKIVLGGRTPRLDTFGTPQQVSFYDEPYLRSDDNETIADDEGEVLYNQLEEWKIVLGGRTPRLDTFGTPQQVSFYDEPYLRSDDNETIADDEGDYMDDETVDSLSPTEGPPPPMPPPTWRPIIKMPDNLKEKEPPAPYEEIGVFGKIKNFLSGLVGGNNDETPIDSGQSKTKTSSTHSVDYYVQLFDSVDHARIEFH